LIVAYFGKFGEVLLELANLLVAFGDEALLDVLRLLQLRELELVALRQGF
jgi:hypothetical protein